MHNAFSIAIFAVSITTAHPIPSIRSAADAVAAIPAALTTFEHHGRCAALVPRLHPTTYQVIDASELVRRNPSAITAFETAGGTVNAIVEFTGQTHAILYLLPAFYRLPRIEQLAVLYHELRGHVMGRLLDTALARRLGITVREGETHGITLEILKGCPGLRPAAPSVKTHTTPPPRPVPPAR